MIILFQIAYNRMFHKCQRKIMQSYVTKCSPVSPKSTTCGLDLTPSPSPSGRGEKYGEDATISWTRASRLYETAWCDKDCIPVQAAVWQTRRVKDGLAFAVQSPARDKQRLRFGGVKSHDRVWIEATQQHNQIFGRVGAELCGWAKVTRELCFEG